MLINEMIAEVYVVFVYRCVCIKDDARALARACVCVDVFGSFLNQGLPPAMAEFDLADWA